MNRDQKLIHLAYILLLFALLLELFSISRSLKPAPACIVVHANGAPAPASCSNPASYQVTP